VPRQEAVLRGTQTGVDIPTLFGRPLEKRGRTWSLSTLVAIIDSALRISIVQQIHDGHAMHYPIPCVIVFINQAKTMAGFRDSILYKRQRHGTLYS
jgi:hypothetical protein